MRNLPLGYGVRLAKVDSVQTGYVVCSFTDQIGEDPVRCPIPHPHAGRGGGIFVGIEQDTQVLLSKGSNNIYFIVAILPNSEYLGDVGGGNIKYYETSYPELKGGEVS